MTTATVSFKLTFPKSDFQEIVGKGDCHAAMKIFERLTKIPVTSIDASFGQAMPDSIGITIDSTRLKTLVRQRSSPAGANPNDNDDDDQDEEEEEEEEEDEESEILTRLRNELDQLKSISAARLFQLNDYRWMIDRLPPIQPYDQEREQQSREAGVADNPTCHFLASNRPRGPKVVLQQTIESQREELNNKQKENDKLRNELAEYQRLSEKFQKTLAGILETG